MNEQSALSAGPPPPRGRPDPRERAHFDGSGRRQRFEAPGTGSTPSPGAKPSPSPSPTPEPACHPPHQRPGAALPRSRMMTPPAPAPPRGTPAARAPAAPARAAGRRPAQRAGRGAGPSSPRAPSHRIARPRPAPPSSPHPEAGVSGASKPEGIRRRHPIPVQPPLPPPRRVLDGSREPVHRGQVLLTPRQHHRQPAPRLRIPEQQVRDGAPPSIPGYQASTTAATSEFPTARVPSAHRRSPPPRSGDSPPPPPDQRHVHWVQAQIPPVAAQPR